MFAGAMVLGAGAEEQAEGFGSCGRWGIDGGAEGFRQTGPAARGRSPGFGQWRRFQGICQEKLQQIVLLGFAEAFAVAIQHEGGAELLDAVNIGLGEDLHRSGLEG